MTVVKRLRYLLEAAGLLLLCGLLRLLPIDAASNLGGALARSIGPRLPISRRAHRNLRLALPELGAEERANIVRGMWDNLGRTAAEYPHLGRITALEANRVIWEDVEPVEALRRGAGPAILASAHMANWEIMPVTAARHGLDMTIIVREPNNPYVRAAIDSLRGVAGGFRAPKGSVGGKTALGVLKAGGVLGLLFDQKLNDGIAVPLFGIPAMTAEAPARLARRFGCPLIPVRIERTGPGRFRVSAQAPLAIPESDDARADVLAVMTRLNEILEDWIRARPEQWLWLHRRWPDDARPRAGA